MNSQVSCPYCNAIVMATDVKTACPRCGESFESANAEHIAEDAAVSKPATPRPAGFLYSRSAMALSFGLAFAILAIGLAILRPWEAKPKPEYKQIHDNVLPALQETYKTRKGSLDGLEALIKQYKK